jgi:hypothetical protein
LQEKYSKIADWLDAKAEAVRKIEAQAENALYTIKDEDEYRRLMREKAMLLSTLAKDGADFCKESGFEKVDKVLKRLERFSSSASSALGIDSVFFMSALLYPEDYKDGDQNDLEQFAEKVRSFD